MAVATPGPPGVAAYEGPPHDLEEIDEDAELTSPGDAALEEELRALGYIE